MHQTENGREILDDLGIGRFVIGNDSAYDTIREMAKAVEW